MASLSSSNTALQICENNPNVSRTNPVLNRCEDPNCSANALAASSAKRKSAQFFSVPAVVERPVLVKGFTSAFQVHGSSAKFADLKNPNSDDAAKTIYRVVPNSHVHVVNYVVVDTGHENLNKISKADANTMSKLVAIQKDSADETLRKLMNAPKVSKSLPAKNLSIGSTVSVTNVQSTAHSSTLSTHSIGNSSILQNTLNSSTLPMQSTLNSSNLSTQNPLNSSTLPMQSTLNSASLSMQTLLNSSTLPMQNPLNSSTLTMQSPTNSTNSVCSKNFQNLPNYPLVPVSSSLTTFSNNSTSINLPLRMHPNLKITAVASAENIPPLVTMSAPSMSMITPAIPSSIVSTNVISPTFPGLLTTSPMPSVNVSPLPTINMQLPVPLPSVTTPVVADTPSKPAFDQMQTEIQELRRTVALLAEAQANSQQQQQQAIAQRSTKKSQTNSSNNSS